MSRAWIVALRRRGALVCWAITMLGALAVVAQTRFVADLSAFLPSRPSPEQALLLDQLSHGSAAKLLLIGIEGGAAPQRAAASGQLAQA
ncbi:MAG: hypothetical protein WA210_09890, partial [Burkholderiaceae bacterium]